MRSLLAFALVACLAPCTAAQPKAADRTPGDIMIDAYLAAETDKLSSKFLDGAKTLEEWTARRPRLQREYLDMLGLQPFPEKTPLKATITRTFESQGVVIDNLHFQSKPGLYVTANLYRPKNNTKKLPTVLYLCGHSNKGRDGNKSAFQDHGLWFASNGYNCLVLDTLQLGEIPGKHHGTYNLDRWWWHSAGYTPAGVECWNGVRAIDYLLTRGDVDPDKLGITGISGGGAATIWIAAADERIKVVAPVSGMADLESYVKGKIINGHCDCMFLYNTYQWEWTTILALIAPRPLLFANSDADPIFPMDANRRIAARMKTIYGMYGKADLTDEYISVGGHAYRPDLRVAIFKFFNKYLKGDAAAPVEDSAKFETIAGKELRVFPTDEDLPKDVLNGRIDETFVPRGAVKLPAAAEFAAWQKKMIGDLRAASFRRFPEKHPGSTGTVEEFGSGTSVGALYESEKSVDVQYSALSTLREEPNRHNVLVWDADKYEGNETPAWATPVVGKERVYHFYPRHGWTKKSPPNTVERSHVLLGRTTDEGKIWDVVGYSTLRGPGVKIRMIGKGSGGLLGSYAALLDPAIAEIVVVDPPTSHRNGAPHLLNVMRVLDVPDALGLLAPRPLTIIGDDPAFDRTEEIYRLAGAADKLKRVKK